MMPQFYQPSFSRHLHSLVVNGFYARELDADDHAFLESVRVRGIANGSLPRTNIVLIEELEFWHLPYAIAPGVERKAGPATMRLPETPEQRALREAKSNAWHARRLLRERDKAIAEAELERERREWEKANETRKMREMLSDAEWEAAAPRPARQFGKVVNRHFIPQWKLDERGELSDADERKRIRKARQEQKRREREEREAQAARAADEWAKAEQEAQAERERWQAEMEALERAARAADEWAKAEQEAQAERERWQAEMEALERAAREAREMSDQANRLERERRAAIPRRPDAVRLKQAVLTLLHSSPSALMFDDLVRATGCTDRAFLNACLTEMVRDGQLLDLGHKP